MDKFFEALTNILNVAVILVLFVVGAFILFFAAKVIYLLFKGKTDAKRMRNEAAERKAEMDAAKKKNNCACPYCDKAEALALGETDDKGIAILYPNILNAYGYDIHGSGSNGISVKINYCPICGKKL